MKKMVAPVMRVFFVDESVALILHGTDSLLIFPLKGNDLSRRQPLFADFGVADRIAVEAQMQLRVEAIKILGVCPAEFGDSAMLMQVRPDGHGLQANPYVARH